jgi:glutathione S-transferase
MTLPADITLYRPDYASVRLIQCSPPSWMVDIALREKALPFTVCELSFAKGEHKTPAMLAKNPRGTIPVLECDDLVFSESLAMLQYLEHVCPEPTLMGQDSLTRGRALERLQESLAVKGRGMELLAYLMRTPDHERDSERVRQSVHSLCQELGFWEAYYQQAPWCAGELPTLADISLFVYLAAFVWLGFALDPDSALGRAYTRMRERPSVRASWPATWTTASAATTPLAGWRWPA